MQKVTITQDELNKLIQAAVLKASKDKPAKKEKAPHAKWGMAPTGSGAIWRFSKEGRCMGAHKLATWIEIFEGNEPKSFKDFVATIAPAS